MSLNIRGLLNEQVSLATMRPHLAPIILHLQFVEDKHLPTLAVTEDGIVHVNPDYITGMDSVNLQACILHETLHLFLDYFGRREERANEKWNIAHDLEISNYVTPKDALKPDLFNLPSGRGAEWYYSKLPDNSKSGIGCSQKMMLSNGKDKSASEATSRAIIRTAENIVAGADQYGAETSLLRYALKIVRPGRTNNTLRALQGSMLVPGLSDVSYERPNRRTQGTLGGIVLPASMHREPKALCILDVSGSMTHHIPRATEIVMSAVKSIGTELMVVAWDTAPICMANVRRSADLNKLKISGGGTDMAAAIISAPKYGHFDTIFVVTDGETPWPEKSQMRKLPPVHILLVRDGEYSRVPDYLHTVKV